MGYYTKKPVVIEARQLTIHSMADIRQWMEDHGVHVVTYSKPPFRKVTGLVIKTLEGNMVASFSDWVIKGIHQEFYPCKMDIFEKSYQKVEEAP